jgi:hypothetical protein
MTATPDSTPARRYLLGKSSDEECAVIEREYLEHEDAVDRIAAAEEDLIEDYLAGDLSSTDREAFERAYLSTAEHRARVEAIRHLTKHSAGAASVADKQRRQWPANRLIIRGPWLALAASILVASALAWALLPSGNRASQQAANRGPQPSTLPGATTGPPPPQPRLFAVTISPATIRGAAQNPPLVIPAGTDLVVLNLGSEADGRRLTPARASIRTVAGTEVWQGTATRPADLPLGTAARIDVPPDRLPADDYLVALYGLDAAGVEQEWAQYFLSVRDR